MRILELPMQCQPCQRLFWGELLVEAPINVALAAMRAVHCPYCGKDRILVLYGETAREAEAQLRAGNDTAPLSRGQ